MSIYIILGITSPNAAVVASFQLVTFELQLVTFANSGSFCTFLFVFCQNKCVHAGFFRS